MISTTQRESTAELATRVFADLQATLLSFEEGARSGDVESIHDMRVTTRRLRVALSNFAACVPRDIRRKAKADVNQLADALGRVRDIDVMLDTLPGMELGEPAARQPIIADLRARLQRRRRYHYLRLIRYFNSDDFATLKKSVMELTNGQATQDQEGLAG